MKLINGAVVTDAVLTSSTVPENDHAAWLVGTSYSIGNRVIVVSTHTVYESVINSNLGNNPVTDDGTRWLTIGATNRWKAFDKILGDPVTRALSIEYVFAPPQRVDAMAFFGLNAATIRVVVVDAAAFSVYDQTFALVDNNAVIDAFTYFFEPIILQDELVILDIPGYVGNAITVTLEVSSGNAILGELAMGQLRVLGTSLEGTSVGIEDFSRKERDAFGRATLVERAFISKVSFNFSIISGDEARVHRILSKLRATPTAYFADKTIIASKGGLVYGYFKDFDIPLSSAGASLATIEIEGLT